MPRSPRPRLQAGRSRPRSRPPAGVCGARVRFRGARRGSAPRRRARPARGPPARGAAAGLVPRTKVQAQTARPRAGACALSLPHCLGRRGAVRGGGGGDRPGVYPPSFPTVAPTHVPTVHSLHPPPGSSTGICPPRRSAAAGSASARAATRSTSRAPPCPLLPFRLPLEPLPSTLPPTLPTVPHTRPPTPVPTVHSLSVCPLPSTLTPPPSRTNWTRLVPPPVLNGHRTKLPSTRRQARRAGWALTLRAQLPPRPPPY